MTRKTRVLLGLGLGLLTSLIALRIGLALWPYPEFEAFLQRPVSTRLLDRQGNLLQVLPLEEGLRREFVALKDLPSYVVPVFLAAEDRRFYWHPGVDPLALVRSLAANASEGRTVSGASTVTMQLARMVRPRPASLAGKAQEMLDALRLEAKLGKDRILELWLNNLSFSFQTEGVASAGRQFFGKPPASLTSEEAAVLAVIPRRPALYSPLLHPEEAAHAAHRLALGSSLGEGVFPTLEYDAFEAAARAARTDQGPRGAPHFMRAFFRQGLEAARARRSPELTTTLDPEVQKALQTSLDQTIAPWEDARLTQGAGIVIDNASGEVLAWVGSRDFDDADNQGEIDGVLVANQPGSTLKPFLYALALEKGFLPSSVLPDIPTDFGRDQVYVPMNFNGRFNGPVRLRVALASSLNVPAVWMLQRLGVRNFEEFLGRAGFASLERQKERLGVGLALGNASVTLAELTRAFSLFPRGGTLPELTVIRSATAAEGTRIVAPATAALIADMLSDNPSRFLGFGHGRVMATSYAAMFKTGTSNQYQNVWALGATPRVTVGVWMGNFRGETIIGRTGSGIPARAVVLVLNQLAQDADRFPDPPGARRVTIDALSGGLATRDSPSVVQEWLPAGATVAPDAWHVRVGGRVETHYPAEYAGWLRQSRRTERVAGTTEDEFAVLKPANGATFFYDPTIPPASQMIAVETTAGPRSGLRVFVDGKDRGALADDGTFWLPVQRGQFTLSFDQGGAVVGQVRVSVR